MKTSRELLKEYREHRIEPFECQRIEFSGVGERDVYNISAPFLINGELVIAGRVEARDNEESEVLFFHKQGTHWSPIADAPRFHMQDPFFTFINGELILGGVSTFLKPGQNGALGWRTVLYRGETLSGLKQLFVGPDGMKDLRLVQLLNGKIGVFTRPQGEKGGRGKIGYACINNLEDLTVELIESAPVFNDQFCDEEWGGCNEIHVLKDGTLGILGHIACFDEKGDRHYYAMTFRMDAATGKREDIKILAVRSDFLASAAKRSDLNDVVFSGGLVRCSNGIAKLYAGISDADAQCITITDPFIRA